MRWKEKKYSDWHSYFAWKPVLINGEWVWFERVLRRGVPQLTAKARNSPWRWDYINSEFDLIKREAENRAQEGNYIPSAEQAAVMAPINQTRGR